MLETSLLEVKPKKYPPAGSNRGEGSKTFLLLHF